MALHAGEADADALGMETAPSTRADDKVGIWRRFFRAPHRRLAVVLGLVIVLIFAFVVMAVGKLDQGIRPLHRLDSGFLSEAEHLRESMSNRMTVNAGVLEALTFPLSSRLSATAPLDLPNTKYQSEYAAYLRGAAGLPGERALQQRVEQLAKQSSELTTNLLAVEVVPPPDVAKVATVNSRLADALGSLEAKYDRLVEADVRAAHAAGHSARAVLLGFGAIALALVLAAAVWVVRDLRRRSLRDEVQGRRNELESRLQRALEMAESEDDIFATIGVAVHLVEPHLPIEMLVADSSRAHLQQVVTANMKPSEGCTVGSPLSCSAAVRGQTQVFESSAAIDACPYLRHLDGAACSAMCVPVTIAGRPMGVLHASAEDHRPPQQEAVAAFELVARRAGERLSLMRAFARTEVQAQTDPLTGLLNRRSLEASAQELVDNGARYVVAYADLDHFKILNDLHGHDAGDRALKLFAHVLRDNVRPSDIPARYGGEEFVVVLPDCTVPDAVSVMERVRSQLAAAVRDAGSPQFTVSVGMAPSAVTHTFSQVVEVADRALLGAKAAGRDRVTAVDGPALPVPDDPSGIPGLAASAVDGNSA